MIGEDNMRNRCLEQFDSIIKVKITGSNIHNYLKRIMKKKIHIIKMIPVSYKEVHVILKYSEYQKLLEYKSVYEITVLQYLGKLKIKEVVKKNSVLLLFMVLGLILILFFSRVIFSVEVIHQDKEIRELLIRELSSYDIKRYAFKKNYQQLEEIEDEILERNKDRLEWIEIIEYGTKYMVRVEERKLNQQEDNFQYQSIVSKKNAILVRVDAIRGEKVRNVNDYVAKGDTVISGYITLPNNTSVATMAEGVVLGEVWYQVDVDYPIVYQETNFTGKSKDVYVVRFLNHRISLFDFLEYRSFQSKDKVLITSNLLHFQLVKEKQFEVEVKDEVYTEDIARNKAIDYIKQKLMKDNEDIVEFKDVKILDASSDEDSIQFQLFVRAIENIGEVVPIREIEVEEKSSGTS